MVIYLVVRPNLVGVIARAEGDGILGEIFRDVRPGGHFWGIPFEELAALGSGRHDVTPPPPRRGPPPEWPRAAEGDWRTGMWLPPDRFAAEDERGEYALTIDGDAYATEVWEIDPQSETLYDRLNSFEDDEGSWHGSFEDLRCCLWFLSRGLQRWEKESGSPLWNLRDRVDRVYRGVCVAWNDRHRTAEGV